MVLTRHRGQGIQRGNLVHGQANQIELQPIVLIRQQLWQGQQAVSIRLSHLLMVLQHTHAGKSCIHESE
jgi:hypothetical protein